MRMENEFAEKIQQKINNYSLYGFQLKYAKHLGGGGTSTRTVDPYAGTGIRELYRGLTEFVQPQIGQGVTPYPGQMVAGPSPIQETGFNLAGGFGPMVSGTQQYFQDVLGLAQPELAGRGMGMAEETLQGVLAPFDPAAATEMWETTWKRPALETWREDIMPSIMEKGVRTAGTADSGPMQRELARSGETLATNLSAQLANLLYSGEQAQMGRQERGVGQAMNLATLPSNIMQGAARVGGMGTDILSQMLNIGSMQRGITGQQLGEEASRWQFAQPWANPYLSSFLGPALGQPPMDTLIQQQGPGGAQFLPGLASMIGGASGGFLGGAGGTGGGGILGGASPTGGTGSDIAMAIQLMGMLSDVRVKRNFIRIDNALEKVNQLEGMTYNFIGEDNRSAGIIAQELEKVLPEGVVEHKGLKYIRVDGVIGLLVNAINELNQKIELRSN